MRNFSVLMAASMLLAGCTTSDSRIVTVGPDLDDDGHTDDLDCDDTDAEVHPDAMEVCDLIDNDCDGLVDDSDDSLDAASAMPFYRDFDGDDFGNPDNVLVACEQPDGHVTDNSDCDDRDDEIHPDSTEVCDDDGDDEDCNGLVNLEDDAVTGLLTFYVDIDNDGFGNAAVTTEACRPPEGYVADDTDCNDGEDAISPGADERCDDVDWNCDNVAKSPGLVSVGATSHASIQAAIDAADLGQAVRICAGTYSENLVIETDLSLLGPEGPESTVIEAANAGSVLELRGAQVEVAGITITGGTGTTDSSASSTALLGGGIFAEAGSLTLTDVILSDNQATHGGAILANDTLLTIIDSIIDDNLAAAGSEVDGGNGGGVNLRGGSLTISGTTVSHNEADRTGGGVVVWVADPLGSGVSIEDSVIEDNSAAVIGGLHILESTVSLVEVEIIDNSADDGGGLAMFSNPESPTGSASLDRVSVEDNHAASAAGGLYCSNYDVHMDDSEIKDNTAEQGGGLLASQCTLQLVGGTSIKQNEANFGGGLVATNTTVSGDFTIANNQASLSGGAGYLQAPSTWTGGTIESNEAEFGAGFYIHVDSSVAASQVSFTDTVFANNNAGEKGGGIRSPGLVSLVLTGVSFLNNRAIGSGAEGGAISAGPTSITLNACTVHNNTATSGGGLFMDAPGSTVGTVLSIASDWGTPSQGTANYPDDMRLGNGLGWIITGTPTFSCTASHGQSSCS